MLNGALRNPGPIDKPARPPASRAKLMAFVTDAQSEASLSSCLSHLSFPDTIIKRGGITRAIQYLATERSPETIIVDMTGVDMPASRMHELAELCEPGVTVIAIGDRNDVGLYRDLVQAGVSEYIVKPITAHLLANALSAGPAGAGQGAIIRKRGKVVAAIGARGGVGTTSVAINLAWYLANRQNRRVLLLDLDLKNGDCSLSLNLTPTPGLREALTNPLRIDSVFLERAVAVHGERLFVLSGEEPLRADTEFTAEAVETLVGALRAQFHYVIADIPRVAAPPYQRALDIADVRIIVADQTLRSVRDTVRLRDAFGPGEGTHCNLVVVNRSGEGGRRALTLQEMSGVKVTPDFVIPFRPKLFTVSGLPRRGPIAAVIAALAAEISGRAPERVPWWSFAT
jgi:pilus assembly protein CpaE